MAIPLGAKFLGSTVSLGSTRARLHPPTNYRSIHTTRAVARWVADDGDYKEVYYDPSRNAQYWSTRPVLVLKRSVEIGARFARWLLETRLQRSGGQDLAQLRAERLRDVLIDLGPAFVKIGQAVSARPDAVPPVYCAELEKLQDRIPPFDNATAMRILEEELGAPPRTVFSELSPDTIAAASLGQVYRGRLRESGREVAVKVQRPGVAAAIGLDTYILRRVAVYVRSARKLNSDLPALLDEWAASLFKELDYRNEAANGTRFRELYSHMEGIYVPEMDHKHTTRRVLVMEWVEGERLRSGSGGYGQLGSEQDLALVDVGVRCSLEQMLEEGFYHADPHPGNLLKTADGRLAYLDFGMMGEVDADIRRGLIRATLHLTNREYAALADDFITLGFLPKGSNKEEVVPALTGVFQQALAGGVSNLSFGDLGTNLGQTMYKYQFRIPPYYTLLVRSLSVLEGIALASDPKYKVLRAAYPWVARRLLTDESPELRDTLLSLLYRGDKFNFKRMDQLLREALKSPARQVRAPPGAWGMGSGMGPAAAAATNGMFGASSFSAAGLPKDKYNVASGGGSGAGAGGMGGGSSSSSESGRAGSSAGASTSGRSSGADTASGWPAGWTGAAARGSSWGSGGGSWGGGGAGRGAGGSGGARKVAAGGGPLGLLLSKEGSLLREVLVEEAAKGVDAAWRVALDSTRDAATAQLAALAQGRSSVEAAAVGAPPLGPALTQQLLRTLGALPRLSEADDVEQLEGLRSVADALEAASSGEEGGSSASSSSSSSDARAQLERTAHILRWLAAESEHLTPAQRGEALRIPLLLSAKVSSRFAARTLRLLLLSPALAPPADAARARAGGASSGSWGSSGAAAAAAGGGGAFTGGAPTGASASGALKGGPKPAAAAAAGSAAGSTAGAGTTTGQAGQQQREDPGGADGTSPDGTRISMRSL